VERLHLTLKVLAGTDVATCARVARAITSSVDDNDATMKAVEALDVASIGRWYDINVQAIEADAASTPVRSVSDADANRILATVVGALTPTEEAQVVATNGAGPVGDEDACGAIRALYRHIEALPPADVAVMALYDAAP